MTDPDRPGLIRQPAATDRGAGGREPAIPIPIQNLGDGTLPQPLHVPSGSDWQAALLTGNERPVVETEVGLTDPPGWVAERRSRPRRERRSDSLRLLVTNTRLVCCYVHRPRDREAEVQVLSVCNIPYRDVTGIETRNLELRHALMRAPFSQSEGNGPLGSSPVPRIAATTADGRVEFQLEASEAREALHTIREHAAVSFPLTWEEREGAATVRRIATVTFMLALLALLGYYLIEILHTL